jgi:putative transposase
MKLKDTVIEIKKPEVTTKDLLTELIRQGARRILAEAVEAEVEEFLNAAQTFRNTEGQQRFVRNGYLPERNIQTGIGDVPVQVPRVRDRAPGQDDMKFNSSLIPRYLRRSQNMEEFLPLLYLKGISTGDFSDVLTPLLGENAKNLSPGVISRLKASWEEEYHSWNKRDLSKKKYVYWWADGIYLQARMEDARDCVLVVMGVTEKGNKELIAIQDGFRESKESWLELLRSLKGLKVAPKVAVGDGALGFWGALREAFGSTRQQRCWVHKTCNVLDKLPKSLQAKAKSDLHEIWMAETKAKAERAFDEFIKTYSAKYPKATECLAKDREELLTFYDFPAEHWVHLRTTNPIESTFATVRHRTKKSKGCFSRTTILTMVFKLCQSAEKGWNRIHGFNTLGDVITGVRFEDGVRQDSDVTVAKVEEAA